MKKELSKPENKEKQINIKKSYTYRFYMVALCIVVIFVGAILFVMYISSLNLVLGAPGIIMLLVGVITLRHYWKQEGNIAVEHIKGVEDKGGTKITINSLSIYEDRVIFENVYEPKGFPWQSENDNKKYYINIFDEVTHKLIPFVLPDQQYCDPNVLGKRILALPAHRKIFERKPTLMQKVKTASLVVAIGVIWLLIMTTTGGG